MTITVEADGHTETMTMTRATVDQLKKIVAWEALVIASPDK